MKVFWLDLGIHIEPETIEENKALQLIWDSVKKTSTGEGDISGPKRGGCSYLSSRLSEDSFVSDIADS